MIRRESKRDIKEVWTEYKAIRAQYEKLEAAAGAEKATPEDVKAFDRIKVTCEISRNVLMEHYLHLVRYNAERIHQKLPDEVELDDLMSSGIFGLMDAIEAFDLDRGVKFETYCAPRIRGAILDELRSMDWVPRLVRSRASKMDQTTRQLEV